MKFAIIYLAILLFAPIASGRDLITQDGKTYHNYRIIAHDAGYLTILDNEGGGRVQLSNLPPDLQRQYGYDPVQAAAFVSAFETTDRRERAAVAQAEIIALGGTADPSSLSGSISTVPTAQKGEASPAVETPVTSSSLIEENSGPLENEEKSKNTGLDPSVDPLSPGAEILEPHYTSPYVEQDHYLAADSAGNTWFSAVDAEGLLHWYRNHAVQDFYQNQSAHRIANVNFPEGAVVTSDASGHWVVTYVDSQGQLHQETQRPCDPYLAGGAWRIHIDGNGNHVATREFPDSHPNELRIVQFPSNATHYSFDGSSNGFIHHSLAHSSILPSSSWPNTSTRSSYSPAGNYTGSRPTMYTGSRPTGSRVPVALPAAPRYTGAMRQ